MSALTAELSDEAKAELAAVFAALREQFPPIQTDRRRVPARQQFAPWQQRRGW